MKILHTADWHLGKRLNEYSRIEEQEAVLNEICEIADEQQVNVVLIAGDLFDTYNPPSEAVELFYRTVCRLSANGQRAVIAIAGNHDSPDRIEAPDPMARACGIIFTGRPGSSVKQFQLASGLAVTKTFPGFIELTIPHLDYPLRLLLTPYANEQSLRQFLGTENRDVALRKILEDSWKNIAEEHCNEEGVNIMMAHLYFMERGGEEPEEPDDEKSVLHIGGAQAIFTESIPKQIQYVALGHLHRYQWITKNPCPVVYSSSPLAYSFSEAQQTKQVMLLQATPGEKVQLKAIPLKTGKRLYRKNFANAEEALAWLKENQECYIELTLQSETYIDARTKKALYQAHNGIISIIPEFTKELADQKPGTTVEITDIKKAFKDYFKYRKGQEPDQELLALFNEVVNASDESDS